MSDDDIAGWELITTDHDTETTDRLAVPGGWLYRTTAYAYTGETDHRDREIRRCVGVSMVFVPQWAIGGGA